MISKNRKCEYPNCTFKHSARGYCQYHYDKYLRNKNYKMTPVNWEEINKKATEQFEEWKKTNKPFPIDPGEYQKLV